MNLWKETIATLEEEGYTWDDVEAVFGNDFQITKENFREVASETVYNPCCGAAQVAEDLIIFLHDGKWLARESPTAFFWERWGLHETPTPPAQVMPVRRLMTADIGWDSLKECNNSIEIMQEGHNAHYEENENG